MRTVFRPLLARESAILLPLIPVRLGGHISVIYKLYQLQTRDGVYMHHVHMSSARKEDVAQRELRITAPAREKLKIQTLLKLSNAKTYKVKW